MTPSRWHRALSDSVSSRENGTERARTLEGLLGGTRPVGGQLQGGRGPGELSAPEGQLTLELLALEPLALPQRVVGVLHRQLGQRRGPALGEGLVERGHLAHQHVRGPAIGDDVVQGEQQDVLSRLELEQGDAQQRAALQIEGALGLFGHQAQGLGLALRGGQGRQIHHRQPQLRGRGDDLHRGVGPGPEGGAQGLVAAHQLGEDALEDRGIERPEQTHGGGNVVASGARLQLLEEPQALLGEGQGQALLARRGPQRRQCERSRGAGAGVDGLGERLEGRGLEEGAKGQVDAEGGADAGDDLGGEKGVAAEFEEVVVKAHALDAQHLAPEGGETLLGVVAGSEVVAGRGEGGVRKGEGLAVELGVGGEGEGVQEDERRGEHELGQTQLEEGAEGGRGEGLGRSEVGDQTLVTGDVLANEGDGLANGGVGEEGGFHLGELDAVAADLHLGVETAEELEDALVAPASQVAGAVEASAGRRGEGVGEEALGGEVGAGEVAAGEAVAADEELTWDSRGNGLEGVVQQVHLGVGDGRADGDGGAELLRASHAEARGEEGALGGAVASGDGEAERLEDTADVRSGDDVASGEQLIQAAQTVGLVLHHLREETRGEVKGGDTVAGEHLTQQLEVTGSLRREDDEAAAEEKRAPELEGGGVEGDGGDEEEGLLGAEVGVVDAVEEALDGAVLDGDGLGTAGGARGEVDVGEIAGRDAGRRGVRGQPVEAQLLHEERGQVRGNGEQGEQGPGSEQEAGRRLLEHEGQTLRGVGGVEREVGAAGLEDGEEGDDELEGALEAEGDEGRRGRRRGSAAGGRGHWSARRAGGR